MPLVKITDCNLQEIITTELSRVPCVGEKITLDGGDGEGAPYDVEYVSWNVYPNPDKPADVMISIAFWDEGGQFAKWFKSRI